MPWMSLSSPPFSTDANWHSVCYVILIVAVQLASNVSLESAIDRQSKFKTAPASCARAYELSQDCLLMWRDNDAIVVHGLD